jgi:hypothetical protein
MKARPGLAEEIQPDPPILVSAKDRLAVIPTRCHVIERAGEFDA